MPHFIDLHEVDKGVLRKLLTRAAALKKMGPEKHGKPLAGKQIALLFEKPSTRTRVSFEVGINQLGADPILLQCQELQIGRGETVADTARVLSRYLDMIMMRCYRHETLRELAGFGSIPVINGLSNVSHPCQVMADIMTYEEHRGNIAGKKVAWLGYCNNVCNSWIHAAVQFGFTLTVGCPDYFAPPPELLRWAKANGGTVTHVSVSEQAVRDADCVVTDVWISMGQEELKTEETYVLLRPFQVNAALMAKARPDAVFMHCLPAHRGEEVTDEVIDGTQSIVWDEAENRLHVQKAIMLWCMGVE